MTLLSQCFDIKTSHRALDDLVKSLFAIGKRNTFNLEQVL